MSLSEGVRGGRTGLWGSSGWEGFLGLGVAAVVGEAAVMAATMIP